MNDENTNLTMADENGNPVYFDTAKDQFVRLSNETILNTMEEYFLVEHDVEQAASVAEVVSEHRVALLAETAAETVAGYNWPKAKYNTIPDGPEIPKTKNKSKAILDDAGIVFTSRVPLNSKKLQFSPFSMETTVQSPDPLRGKGLGGPVELSIIPNEDVENPFDTAIASINKKNKINWKIENIPVKSQDKIDFSQRSLFIESFRKKGGSITKNNTDEATLKGVKQLVSNLFESLFNTGIASFYDYIEYEGIVKTPDKLTLKNLLALQEIARHAMLNNEYEFKGLLKSLLKNKFKFISLA